MSDTKGEGPEPRLVVSLRPKLHDALHHPLRREIVRELNASKRPLSIWELEARIGSSLAAEISYHVRVLRRCEAVDGEGERQVDAGAARAYRSLIEEDVNARAFLRLTEESDRERKRAAVQPPAHFLMMFRVPRPVRTLRLGLRRKPQSEAG